MGSPYDDNAYVATIIDHVDGDTSHVLVSLGFDAQIKLTIRWADLDAPEMSTQAGRESRDEVIRRLPIGSRCLLTTIKDRREKYGRYLGTFWTMPREPGDVSVNDQMVGLGYARPYDGGKR